MSLGIAQENDPVFGIPAIIVNQSTQLQDKEGAAPVSVVLKPEGFANKLTSNSPNLAQIVLLPFPQNKANNAARGWGPGVRTGQRLVSSG